MFIEISCPADINIVIKEEKLLKYCDLQLAIDFQQMHGASNYYPCGVRMHRCSVIKMYGSSC